MNVTRCFRVLVLAILAVSFTATSAKSQIIDFDFTMLNPDFATPANLGAFQAAEAFWESRVLGYSNTLPIDIQTQLTGGLTIFVSDVLTNDDVGTLAESGIMTGVTSVLGGRGRAVAETAVLNVAPDTFNQFTTQELTDVLIHEIGHSLGFGTLWEANNLVSPIPTRGGVLQYRGINARQTFAEEAGFGVPQVAFVPIEQQGGPGTALAHWDDDNFFFNSAAVDGRVELLTGFFIDNTERFISETTFASLVDLGYVVSGFNEDELIDFNVPITPGFPVQVGSSSPFNVFVGAAGAFDTGLATGPSAFDTTQVDNPFGVVSQRAENPFSFSVASLTAAPDASAVPEPSALMLVLAGMSGMLLRRQRTSA